MRDEAGKAEKADPEGEIEAVVQGPTYPFVCTSFFAAPLPENYRAAFFS
jgi:hypothetical protein